MMWLVQFVRQNGRKGKERKGMEWKMDYARQVEYIVITLMKRIN